MSEILETGESVLEGVFAKLVAELLELFLKSVATGMFSITSDVLATPTLSGVMIS